MAQFVASIYLECFNCLCDPKKCKLKNNSENCTTDVNSPISLSLLGYSCTISICLKLKLCLQKIKGRLFEEVLSIF